MSFSTPNIYIYYRTTINHRYTIGSLAAAPTCDSQNRRQTYIKYRELQRGRDADDLRNDDSSSLLRSNKVDVFKENEDGLSYEYGEVLYVRDYKPKYFASN